ncbi:MAG: amino acid adenylation domain-containing protein, partial [Flavobacteriales bacterium]
MKSKDKCLHHLLEDQVEKTPDAIAVFFEGHQLTYRGLNQRANRFAHYLNKMGVKNEVPVGIFLERSIELVIAIWGLLKSGGIYVPLDIALPEARLTYIINDTQMPFLVTKRELASRLPEGVHCIYWNEEQRLIEQESSESLANGLSTENLAYLVYTSGSTGNPKGVMIPQRVFTRCEFWAKNVFHFTSADRFLLNFFRAPEELFYPLFIGATLILSPRDAERDTALLVKTIHGYHISVIGLTPSVLNAFLNEPDLEQCQDLKHVYCAGEALPIDIQQRFFARLNANLYNFYGLAEAPYTSIWHCKHDDTRRIIPIGHPIDATVHILNEDLQPVHNQNIGEIYIGGPGLARGYLNMPKLTADRFVILDDTLLYNTGDRAYYDTEGQIIFLGRSDHQVKIRGLRVELGEIEAALRQHFAVSEAAVVFQNEQLIAYLALKHNELIRVENWRTFLETILPGYMLPSAYVILNEMPLATTGKIDRKALPQPKRQVVTDLRTPTLSEPDRHKILVEWNATQADYPNEKCVHQLFEDQAKKTPDTIAVFFEDQQLTYIELNQKANQLAHYLQKLGVKPEMLVGICVERSVEMMIGLLGILKAGAAYVPIDPTYPPERVAMMLNDAEVAVVVAQQHGQASLPPHSGQVVWIDTDWPRIQQNPTTPPHVHLAPDNLAYMIYTSGSTGTPKGVQIPHRAFLNFLKDMAREPGLAPSDRLLAVTSLSFDIAGLELLLPVLVGGQVVLAGREMVMDGAQLVAALAIHEITVMQATPATWQLLVTQRWKGQQGLRILCGGEQLPLDLAHQLEKRSDGIWNLYGPTETTVWSTRCALRHDPVRISIGRPIANTQIYILDSQMQPVPIGATGELYIGGDGVARGYLNRPGLTSEKFILNPLGDGRLYRTGDLARYFPDGNIEYLRRMDQQIKLRGFRIELGEIESVISQFAGIKQTVVIVREDHLNDKRLVAYLMTNTDMAINELQDYLRTKLPVHMLPAAFVVLDKFPLTQNGKIDRKALLKPEYANINERFLAPRNVIEEILASIWAEVLNIDHIGIYDNFFALGGHSLS